MTKPVTIVISPRDRYSKLAECLMALYANTDASLFNLIVLNLGYPAKDWAPAMEVLKSKSNVRCLDYGRMVPIEAMAKVRLDISTPYAVFMDNDSRAESNWLPPLIEAAKSSCAAVTYPVILEKAGVDRGESMRTHLFSTELRLVDVESSRYLFEHKTYRRAAIDELPKTPTESQSFELHCVMFNTEILKRIELPLMTIREHLDIGLQLRVMGEKILVVPNSRIVFDNLATRPAYSDLKYFDLRWNSTITHASSRLFEGRWGLKFYSEQSIYYWAKRRRLFMMLRWLGAPISLANLFDRIISGVKRRVSPVWDPLPDPYAESYLLFSVGQYSNPRQLSHETEFKPQGD